MKYPEFKTVFQETSFINSEYAMLPEGQEFVYNLVKNVPKGGVVLEIGVAHGKTAYQILQIAKINGFKYYTIDNFSLGSTYDEVKNNLQKAGGDFEIIAGDSRYVNWDKEIDFLIIDGGHAEFDVKPDCERFLPFVKPGGYVVFDDYDKEYDPNSAHWAIRYWADYWTGNWNDLGQVKGDKIRQRPEKLLQLIPTPLNYERGSQGRIEDHPGL